MRLYTRVGLTEVRDKYVVKKRERERKMLYGKPTEDVIFAIKRTYSVFQHRNGFTEQL